MFRRLCEGCMSMCVYMRVGKNASWELPFGKSLQTFRLLSPSCKSCFCSALICWTRVVVAVDQHLLLLVIYNVQWTGTPGCVNIGRTWWNRNKCPRCFWTSDLPQSEEIRISLFFKSCWMETCTQWAAATNPLALGWSYTIYGICLHVWSAYNCVNESDILLSVYFNMIGLNSKVFKDVLWGIGHLRREKILPWATFRIHSVPAAPIGSQEGRDKSGS